MEWLHNLNSCNRGFLSLPSFCNTTTFIVERLLARGAVEITEEIVFDRQDWQKVEEAAQKLVRAESEGDKCSTHSGSFNQETQTVGESSEELGSETPDIIVTIEASATKIEELTEDEEKERHRLELKVE